MNNNIKDKLIKMSSNLYKVDIENKKQVIKANKKIEKDTKICLVIENNYLIPKLTFSGKILKHSDDSNCYLKYDKFNTYYLFSSKDIDENDILSVDITKAPWYIR